MAIVYLFLQDLWATVIPMITIPVSLIATFIVIYLLGFDINILTLFAMILAIHFGQKRQSMVNSSVTLTPL